MSASYSGCLEKRTPGGGLTGSGESHSVRADAFCDQGNRDDIPSNGRGADLDVWKMAEAVRLLVERMHWLAHEVRINEARLREIVEAVLAEIPDQTQNEQAAEARRQLMRAAGA